MAQSKHNRVETEIEIEAATYLKAVKEVLEDPKQNWIEILAVHLTKGDQIVILANKRTGQSQKTVTVKEVMFPAKGCRNMHVVVGNSTWCYDRLATVKVRT